MNKDIATLKFDFYSGLWLAQADWEDLLHGYGDSPQDAIQALKDECNKHDLWPKD